MPTMWLSELGLRAGARPSLYPHRTESSATKPTAWGPFLCNPGGNHCPQSKGSRRGGDSEGWSLSATLLSHQMGEGEGREEEGGGAFSFPRPPSRDLGFDLTRWQRCSSVNGCTNPEEEPVAGEMGGCCPRRPGFLGARVLGWGGGTRGHRMTHASLQHPSPEKPRPSEVPGLAQGHIQLVSD